MIFSTLSKQAYRPFHRGAGCALLVCAITSACVQVESRPDFDNTRDLIEASTGRQAIFDPYGKQLAQDEIEALLAGGLSLDDALTLALVHNRELQAAFQEIGIDHSALVQSQLKSNPSLDMLLRFPSGGGGSVLESIITMDLFELWRIPLQEQVAQHRLEATALEVARRATELLAATRASYYSAVAAGELCSVAEQNVGLASQSFEAVQSLYAAGVVDAFEENLARGPLLAAQLEWRTAVIKASDAKRELAKLLCLDGPVDELLLTGVLPQTIAAHPDGEALVHQAINARLDLQAIKSSILALEAGLQLEEHRTWGDVDLGLGAERSSGNEPSLLGPSINLALPIFDQNQAQVARAGFELEQMLKLFESAQISVAHNVRSGTSRVNAVSSSLAFYQQEFLPQAELSLTLAGESFAAGESTLLLLIEVQRQLLEARRSHVLLRLEAANAQAELERLVGAPTLESTPSK